jgi:hypothetical protein
MSESFNAENKPESLSLALKGLLTFELEKVFSSSFGGIRVFLTVLFVILVFFSAAFFGLVLFVLSSVYLITSSLKATSIAGVVMGSFSLLAGIYLFISVRKESFWEKILKFRNAKSSDNSLIESVQTR